MTVGNLVQQLLPRLFNHLIVFEFTTPVYSYFADENYPKKFAEPRQTDNSPDKKMVKSEDSVYLSLALLSG